jgi:hypothetical protein
MSSFEGQFNTEVQFAMAHEFKTAITPWWLGPTGDTKSRLVLG